MDEVSDTEGELAALTDRLVALPAIATAELIDGATTIGLVGKGSNGKSTTAIALGVLATRSGYRVLIVDGDPQNRSIVSALVVRQDTQARLFERLGRNARLPQLDVAVANGHAELLEPYDPPCPERLDTRYDLVIFDFPGAPSPLRTRWLSSLRLVVLLMEPSAVSVWATQRILQGCRALGADPVGVMNKVGRGPRVAETKKAFENTNLVFGPSIRARVAHQDAMALGTTVSEIFPRHDAAKDMNAVYAWCCERIGLRVARCTPSRSEAIRP